jgi:hypothetical protein
VLERAGLISRRVEGTRRPCRLNEDGVAAIERWTATMRDALDRNYERLDEVLARMMAPRRKRKGAQK